MFPASFSTEKMSPTITAMTRLTVKRQKRIGPHPNAEAVLNTTMGFKTGAASKNEMPAESGNPFLKRRRVSGTTPHSQTGKIMPMKAPLIAAAAGRFETHLLICSRSTNTSTSPDANVPRRRYGTASTKMPRKTVAKTLSLSHNQEKNPAGIMLEATRMRMLRTIARMVPRERRLIGVEVSTS